MVKVRIVGGWMDRDLNCKKPQKQFILPETGSKTKQGAWGTWGNTDGDEQRSTAHGLTALQWCSSSHPEMQQQNTQNWPNCPKPPRHTDQHNSWPGRVATLRSCPAKHRFSHSSFNQSLKPKAQSVSFSTDQEQSHCAFSAQVQVPSAQTHSSASVGNHRNSFTCSSSSVTHI